MSGDDRGEVLHGRWRSPRSTGTGDRGGLDEAAVAGTLGYRGGLVPLAVHLEQFQPLLVDRFGPDWWRHGGVSARLLAPTLDGEPVCCAVEPLGSRGARIWLNGEGGSLVLEGTATMGGALPDEGPDDAEGGRRGDLRILEHVQADATCGTTVTVPAARLDERLGMITEPMRGYREVSEFGGRVVPLASLVGALAPVDATL